MEKSLHQSGVTAHRQIVIDAFGVDAAVGAENEPLLLLVEGDFGFADDFFVGGGVGVK